MTAHTCKNCLQEEKIIKRCKKCGHPCCSNCSINEICMDCIAAKNEKSGDMLLYDNWVIQ